jgi:predicted metal-dependent HD superfamily phosphohydrolase
MPADPISKTTDPTLERFKEEMRTHYAEAARGHHNQAHIDFMLDLARVWQNRLHHPAAVDLAIWAHDGVYDPAAEDNEIQSATLLRQLLEGATSPLPIDLAAALVLATEHHRVPPAMKVDEAADCALFLDFDMAVLGSDPDDYRRYSEGIAKEYQPLHGDASYRVGRAAFLSTLLKKTRLFLTDDFEIQFGVQARANIKKEIATLDAQIIRDAANGQ